MKIHVVTAGDTVSSVAAQYGVSPTLLGQLNQVEDGRLAVGQTLVVYEDAELYLVRQGDTLYGISRETGVPLRRLYQNNYFLGGRERIRPGDKLVLSLNGEKRGTLGVNGYAYPFISQGLLEEELPYMTYLTPFTYGITPEGGLVPLGDEKLLAEAARYGIQPWLHLSTWNGERFDSELGALILRRTDLQEELLAVIRRTVEEKGFDGVDVDFEFLPGERRRDYAAFIENLRRTLNPLGRTVVVALAPKTYADQPGLLYEAHDYGLLSAAADGVLLMTYEWGYTYGPPMAVAPLPQVKRVLDYALTEMPPEKIFLGVPTYGYDWPLPYERGRTRARSLSPTEAVALAMQYGAEIQFDSDAKAPWFRYTAADGVVHEVWFEDARSSLAKFSLAAERGLQGVGLWNLMRRAPQTYLVLNGAFTVEEK